MLHCNWPKLPFCLVQLGAKQSCTACLPKVLRPSTKLRCKYIRARSCWRPCNSQVLRAMSSSAKLLWHSTCPALLRKVRRIAQVCEDLLEFFLSRHCSPRWLMRGSGRQKFNSFMPLTFQTQGSQGPNRLSVLVNQYLSTWPFWVQAKSNFS